MTLSISDSTSKIQSEFLSAISGLCITLACFESSVICSHIWNIISLLPVVTILLLGCYLLPWRGLFLDTVIQCNQIFSLKALCIYSSKMFI